MPIMLYTKVDAQCDQLAAVISQTKLITYTMVNMPRRNFLSPELTTKFQRKVSLFRRYPNSFQMQCTIG